MDNIDPKAKLLKAITPILLRKGPKNLTMDYVAKSLSISKRTLYELFGSKEIMVSEVINYVHQFHKERLEAKLKQFDNAMEQLAYALLVHQQLMQDIDLNFFRDMDTRYPRIRQVFENASKSSYQGLMRVFEIGVEQGVFRHDANYKVIAHLFRIQLESLKRMEQLFPPEVTLVEAFNSISTNLLRAIATPKGMESLKTIEEKMVSNFR